MIGGGDTAMAAVERRLGYTFGDRSYLVTALTHGTAVDGDDEREDYQRLEFLGDRVLGLVVSTMLMEEFPDADEGELSRRFADLVRKETCADVAVSLELGAALIVGGGQQQLAALRTRNVLGDICESVIAAIYVDSDFETAQAFVERNWHQLMLTGRGATRSAKTALQEWGQQQGMATPKYRISDKSGPDHHPHFVIEVSVGDLAPERGEGRSRRAAEQDAAANLLTREGVGQSRK
jgi:ribonuclease-3